jgi:hypothetical protein
MLLGALKSHDYCAVKWLQREMMETRAYKI